MLLNAFECFKMVIRREGGKESIKFGWYPDSLQEKNKEFVYKGYRFSLKKVIFI